MLLPICLRFAHPPSNPRHVAPSQFYYRSPAHRKAYVLSFAFTFDREDDAYEFAYSFPYSYSRLTRHLALLESLRVRLRPRCVISTAAAPLRCARCVAAMPRTPCAAPRTAAGSNRNRNSRPQLPYVRRELLCRSLQGRRIDCITVSDPEAELARLEAGMPRPVALITGRVHPGETPSSFVTEGLLNFIVEDRRGHRICGCHKRPSFHPLLVLTHDAFLLCQFLWSGQRP